MLCLEKGCEELLLQQGYFDLNLPSQLDYPYWLCSMFQLELYL